MSVPQSDELRRTPAMAARRGPQTGKRTRIPRFARTVQGAGGLILFAFVVLVALIGPLFAPYPLDRPVGIPGSPAAPGAPFGLDELGRDVLSRFLHGGLPVLSLAIVSIAAAYLLGVQLGMIAGLNHESRTDTLIMRVVDVHMAFPPLLLLLVLISGSGTSPVVVAIGIVLVLFPGVVRIVRSATQEVATTGFVDAAVVRGERPLSIMFREVLPNIVQTVLADLGIRFSSAIVLAASLNFLGLGSRPPAANWGLMVAENRTVLASNIWAALLPAAMLAVLIIAVNLIADAYTKTLGRSKGADS
ncbi:ABC transporter permease [Actinomadura sp. 6N118]|uniref:ABC transporter permease n=1 Tax=Actinomadura sp. 6N118 TaxID=3375151 RepID=UPI0037BD5150